MGKFIDLTGQKFNRLTAVLRVHNTKNGTVQYRCVCDCGVESIVRGTVLKAGHTKSCGCLQKEKARVNIKKNRSSGLFPPNWKGGRHLDGKGYVRLYYPNHPNAKKSRYILEHVLVMSQHLGRPLTKGETVHHRNGVKADNRLENLELRCGNHGRGQSVEDLNKWAIEHLEKYGYTDTKN